MHCITNAMKQIFNFYGHPLSEEMLFGLGEGLDFAYINMAHSPMVSGRSKIMEFEGILSKRLGVGMKFRKGRDNNKSFEAARKMLSSGMVVEYLLKPASEDELFEAVFKCIERIDQTRGPDDPVPLEEPGPEPPSFHENAQPRGSKVLLIQQVKEYLQENYTQRITLNSAAALVYLTPTYLSKLFAEVEGMGFSEYLSALRIQHAKEALLDYHRRIYEIAAQVGYQDVKHFMKVFKKQVGMTPREYRESHLF